MAHQPIPWWSVFIEALLRSRGRLCFQNGLPSFGFGRRDGFAKYLRKLLRHIRHDIAAARHREPLPAFCCGSFIRSREWRFSRFVVTPCLAATVRLRRYEIW